MTTITARAAARKVSVMPASTVAETASIARLESSTYDWSRFGHLVRRRAWRHLAEEFAGHRFAPFARISGAICDARLIWSNAEIEPKHLVAMAPAEWQGVVCRTLQAVGAVDAG